MKVIKRGTPPAEVPWRGTCLRCKSELEATRDEVRVEYDARENGEFGRADCEICGFNLVFYPVKERR